jgi:hypothetical protein
MSPLGHTLSRKRERVMRAMRAMIVATAITTPRRNVHG